jgi:hypothetical protein
MTILVILVISTVVYAANNNIDNNKEFKQKLKALKHKVKLYEHRVDLDNVFRDEIVEFILSNKDYMAADFKARRNLYVASVLFIKDISGKTGANKGNYHQRIKDKKFRETYKIALDISKKGFYRSLYACANGDESKVEKIKQNREKILKERSRRYKEYNKNYEKNRKGPKNYSDTDEYIRYIEKANNECRFASFEDLFRAYQFAINKGRKKYKSKFNELAIQAIKDDQVVYDYIYKNIDEVDDEFVSNFRIFIAMNDPLRREVDLDVEQTRFITESIFTKHQEVFNLENNVYKPKGYYDLTETVEAGRALMSLSRILRYHELNDLNEKLLETYYGEGMNVDIRDTMTDEFRDYLKEWKAKREAKH